MDQESEVDLLARGVIGLMQRLEAREAETRLRIEELKLLRVPCCQNLNERVRLLEERAEQQTQDVLEVIRKKFGKR